MTFIEQYQAAEDGVFIRKVHQALIKSALAVKAEAADVKGHAARSVYASKVLANPLAEAKQVAYGVATNQSLKSLVTGENTDADIEFTVNSVFDAYAGAE